MMIVLFWGKLEDGYFGNLVVKNLFLIIGSGSV